MRILLDTHALIWALTDPSRLTVGTRSKLQTPSNDVFFSPVSLAEIAIKFARGKPDFRTRPEQVLQSALATGFDELPLHAIMTLGVADMPRIHDDPFDRLLLSQAREAGCRLYTNDAKLLSYGDPAFPA